MEEELKPCPFCGGEGRKMKYEFGWYIACCTCGAMTATCQMERLADSKWNRRTEMKVR